MRRRVFGVDCAILSAEVSSLSNSIEINQLQRSKSSEPSSYEILYCLTRSCVHIIIQLS